MSSSVQQLLGAGGLISLASVLIRLLQPLLPASMEGPLAAALMESHLGANALASWHAPEPSALLQAAALAAALCWGGLCALLQAGGASAGSGLKLLPLAGARLLTAGIAAVLTLLLGRPLSALAGLAAPAFASLQPALQGGAIHSLWSAPLFGPPCSRRCFWCPCCSQRAQEQAPGCAASSTSQTRPAASAAVSI